MTGRAKWDAWTNTGGAVTSKAEAEARYVAIAESLGWKGPFGEDNNWDNEDSGGGGSGMGTAVSAMARPEAVQDNSLHGLAVANRADELALLWMGQASTGTRDEFGYTALHLAADRGHTLVVQLLLQRGADRNIQDEDGLTAAELAEAAGHDGICLRWLQLLLLRLLLLALAGWYTDPGFKIFPCLNSNNLTAAPLGTAPTCSQYLILSTLHWTVLFFWPSSTCGLYTPSSSAGRASPAPARPPRPGGTPSRVPARAAPAAAALAL
ncbi:Acyl-binding protein [Mycena indigotica]|uniref:Acyl-binding protein n=1 Tax=Mycena indigotica TaxID=2126181 RepID=A0A8H6W8E8_9AGAR|nr:Acyl-binding protein [Mycena indigotica]KAF7306841.1 Acyl-binding protein [Mycena indigotica]